MLAVPQLQDFLALVVFRSFLSRRMLLLLPFFARGVSSGEGGGQTIVGRACILVQGQGRRDQTIYGVTAAGMPAHASEGRQKRHYERQNASVERLGDEARSNSAGG